MNWGKKTFLKELARSHPVKGQGWKMVNLLFEMTVSVNSVQKRIPNELVPSINFTMLICPALRDCYSDGPKLLFC